MVETDAQEHAISLVAQATNRIDKIDFNKAVLTERFFYFIHQGVLHFDDKRIAVLKRNFEEANLIL